MGWTLNPFDDHLDKNTTAAEIKEKLSHADLSDMPDTLGTNTDHDVRLLKPHVPTIVVAASDSAYAGGADYTCDGTADDVQINAALAALPATGGKVQLLDGTYNISAQIAFGKNYSALHGSGWSTIINSASYSTDHTINLASYDWCEIANLKMIGKAGGGATKDLIYGSGCDDFVLRNCYLSYSDNYGVNLDSCYRPKILNNTFYLNDTIGLVVNCDKGIISGNLFRENKTNGMYLFHESLGENVVVGNISTNNTSSGYDIRSLDTTFISNISANNGAYGAYLAATSLTVSGNVFRNNTNDQINAVSALNSCIFSNTLRYSTSGHGIYISACHYSTIFGNNIYRPANNKDDIYVTATTKCSILNNSCVSAGTSYSERAINLINSDDCLVMGNKSVTWGGVHGTCGIAEDSSCTGNIIVGNDMEGETTPYSLSGGTYRQWNALTPVSTKGRFLNVVTTTTAYTVTSVDDIVVCNSGTAFTVTLPTAATGQRYHIKNINTGVVTIDGAGSDTIDGSTTLDIYQWEDVIISCYAANSWGVI